MLTLPEELTLIALNDEKGNIVSSASMSLNYGLAGAILLELILSKKLILDDQRVSVSEDEETGDDLFDDVLCKIRASKKQYKLDHWIQCLASKFMFHKVVDRLVQKKILRHEEHRVLWVFPVKLYPEENPRPELELRQRLHAVVKDRQKPELRSLLLLSLIRACGMTKELFDKENLKEANRYIQELIEHEPVGEAVDRAIQAVNVAITTAAAAASTSVILTSTS